MSKSKFFYIVAGFIIIFIPLAVFYYKGTYRINQYHNQLNIGPTVTVKGKVIGGRSGGKKMPSSQISFPVKDQMIEVEFFHLSDIYYFGEVEVEYLENDPAIYRVGNAPKTPKKVSGEE